MIVSNILSHVLFVKFGNSRGTAFTIDYENKQYIVTAKHLFPNPSTADSVEVFRNNTWNKIDLKLTGYSQSSDVIVFAPPCQMSKNYPMPSSSAGVLLAQDVFFIGFPFGISNSAGITQGLPFPLVKKACLSAMQIGVNGENIILLDGHNNPGFSGGPVVFSKHDEPFKSSFKIMGVISGYRYNYEPVYHNVLPTTATVRSNTGIIICSDIKHAIDEIENNPNGISVTS